MILKYFLSENFDFNSNFFLNFSKFFLKLNDDIETPISYDFFNKVFSLIYQKDDTLKRISLNILSESIEITSIISPLCFEFFYDNFEEASLIRVLENSYSSPDMFSLLKIFFFKENEKQTSFIEPPFSLLYIQSLNLKNPKNKFPYLEKFSNLQFFKAFPNPITEPNSHSFNSFCYKWIFQLKQLPKIISPFPIFSKLYLPKFKKEFPCALLPLSFKINLWTHGKNHPLRFELNDPNNLSFFSLQIQFQSWSLSPPPNPNKYDNFEQFDSDFINWKYILF